MLSEVTNRVGSASLKDYIRLFVLQCNILHQDILGLVQTSNLIKALVRNIPDRARRFLTAKGRERVEVGFLPSSSPAAHRSCPFAA